MRGLAALLPAAPLLVASVLVAVVPVAAVAADLDRPIVILPAPAPSAYACILGMPIQYSRAPRTTTIGTLPRGIAVEILDVPYDPIADLWVRLAAPGSSIYYGWVRTSGLRCL
ncbi:hypothetical protein DLJ53_18720 [Acuticoccus sediminis]|uniref:SH3 domain-containing protein n=1 Tax=Acuticoccus sediminis TaxID=2184697 RepID=A0A8B2NVQ4_9HYPH|nr:hypothetical protein [Acuticoccus sediminis]RAH99796.1 hypothetical protein DLJ53_18720 [Acuticoccus sediminis]